MHFITIQCLIISFEDATSSAVASFSDARCTAGGVCPNDPLVFTCGVKNTLVLQVALPTGYREHAAIGDTANSVVLPAGFKADSLIITPIDIYTNNFTLTLSIENASLLNGGQIICDDAILRLWLDAY